MDEVRAATHQSWTAVVDDLLHLGGSEVLVHRDHRHAVEQAGPHEGYRAYGAWRLENDPVLAVHAMVPEPAPKTVDASRQFGPRHNVIVGDDRQALSMVRTGCEEVLGVEHHAH